MPPGKDRAHRAARPGPRRKDGGERAPSQVVGSSASLAAALGASALLLFALQAIFVVASPAIVAAKPATPPELVVPWARWAVAEHDGIETYVALPGLLLFLVASAGLAFAVRRIPRSAATALAVAGVCAAFVVVARTRSTVLAPPAATIGMLLGAGAAVLVAAAQAACSHDSTVVRRTTLAVGFAAFTALVVLSLPPPSVEDYGYFIGPALKLFQGERLGSFYLQYNLIETLLFLAMMAFGPKLHVMAVVLSVVFAAWYLLYGLLAARLFRHRFVGVSCVASLVVVRFFAIRDHPAQFPQVLPLRLDLWVPLLLAVVVWGLRSWRTSLGFGLVYALDATFGFLFAGVYAGALAISWWRSGEGVHGLRSTAPLLLPAGVAGSLQKLVFGSWTSPAAAHYLSIQIGFMPISGTSMFWPIAMLLGWAAVVHAGRLRDPAARAGLLLCAFAAVEFVYFFGRSHDYNLLNVSGIWLFAAFLALDQSVGSARARALVATGLVVTLAVLNGPPIVGKLSRVAHRIGSGARPEPDPLEAALIANRGRVDPGVLFADRADAYINYRLGLRQRGFFVPFFANVLLDDTAAWMDQQMREGIRVATLDDRWSVWVHDFNAAPVMQRRGRRFAIVERGGLLEIMSKPNTAGRE